MNGFVIFHKTLKLMWLCTSDSIYEFLQRTVSLSIVIPPPSRNSTFQSPNLSPTGRNAALGHCITTSSPQMEPAAIISVA